MNKLVIDYRLNENGNWEMLFSSETKDGEKIKEWVGCTINEVPVHKIFDIWDNMINELSLKEARYNRLKDKYDNDEFEIVYVADIDFKGMYGSTSETVRRKHAKKMLKLLDKEISDLELSINYLKRMISFLKHVLVIRSEVVKASGLSL